MRKITGLAIAVMMASLLLPLDSAEAATVTKKFPFQLDKWFDVDFSEGPITIHRVRVRKMSAGFKSKVFRPGNSEYLEDIEIAIEYTNDSSKDRELGLRVRWLDAGGTVIDGYNGEEDMDEESRHDETTNKLSTLRYGLDKARTLSVELDF